MTQQEFYLQAAIQIAAALNNAVTQRTGENTPNDRQNIAECAINGAVSLLNEAQDKWNLYNLGAIHGALFDTDPNEPPNDDYTLHINFGGNKDVIYPIIADNDAVAIEKALDIFERAYTKQGARHYSLIRGKHVIKQG